MGYTLRKYWRKWVGGTPNLLILAPKRLAGSEEKLRLSRLLKGSVLLEGGFSGSVRVCAQKECGPRTARRCAGMGHQHTFTARADTQPPSRRMACRPRDCSVISCTCWPGWMAVMGRATGCSPSDPKQTFNENDKRTPVFKKDTFGH